MNIGTRVRVWPLVDGTIIARSSRGGEYKVRRDDGLVQWYPCDMLTPHKSGRLR